MDITVFSRDNLIREVSIKRVMQSMEIATLLNCRAVIFHTNFIPDFLIANYYAKWVEDNRLFWSDVIRQFPLIDVYIENMFDYTPKMISLLAKSMENEKGLVYALIVGMPFFRGLLFLIGLMSYPHI